MPNIGKLLMMVLVASAIMFVATATVLPKTAYANGIMISLNLTVGESSTVPLPCNNLNIDAIINSNEDVATAKAVNCIDSGGEALLVTCNEPGTTDIDISSLLGIFGARIHVTCTLFVVPESPIGIIALTGSSLGALGGFLFWKRKHSSNSQPHSLGDLGI